MPILKGTGNTLLCSRFAYGKRISPPAKSVNSDTPAWPPTVSQPFSFGHPEFTAFTTKAKKLFLKWQTTSVPRLKGFAQDGYPRETGAECAFPDHVAGPSGHPSHLRNHQAPTRLLMKDTIQIGDLSIRVTRKPIKHVHLSVHPPDGRVTLSAPKMTRLDVARAYAVSKVGWIREQQSRLRRQARETPRQFIERESHYLWGRRHLLTVAYRETKPLVSLDHRRISLTARPGSSAGKRAEVIHEWHKSLLHAVVPPLIKKWEPKLKVKVSGYFLQRMKTKWGSCNHRAGHIRLNTELVKKPKDLLEYVIVHEMVHLIEPVHSDRFIAILQQNYPTWREARAELNELPLAAEVWRE